tara:strand:- start:45 stop:272 length:228 start_codon:yes stop_codon:yes gene_type:complete
MLGRGQDREWRVRVIETLATCDCRITQERRSLISRSLAFESAETIDDDDQRGSAQGARELREGIVGIREECNSDL